MLSRKVKAAFYSLAGPLMYVNGRRYRFFNAPDKGLVKVHLGPGQSNYLDGWINVDANMFTGKCDIWADLRNALPFKNDTVDIFYSHHVIEHLPDLPFHFKDMFRCLKKGGKIRIGGPNGDSAILKFVEGDKTWFNDYPDNRQSIGGRFENFVFCRQEHLTILTRSFLQELLEAAGFTSIRFCLPVKETNFSDFIDDQVLAKEWETTYEAPHTLLVEAIKE